MPKFSVKKPFTILVAVILVIVLGVVSIWNMTTDLLPSMSLPYLVVVTTYPGATPEKVEADLTAPLESTLGTVNGVENVTSTSSENYSMVMLEFAEDTNMDSAMVKVSTELNQLADSLPDMAGTPMVIEVSADMMATQYVAVEADGMDIYALSDYVEEEIVPEMERLNGVASVSAIGLVERQVEVTLQQDLIDEVNDKLLVQVSDRLDEAKQELTKAQKEVDDGLAEMTKAEKQLNSGKSELATQKDSLTDQLKDAIASLNGQIPGLEQKISDMEGQITGLEQQLAGLQQDPSSIPDVTVPEDLGIDEALLQSTNAILAQVLGDQHKADQMPADLADAIANPAKLQAMRTEIAAAGTMLNAGIQQQLAAVGVTSTDELNTSIQNLTVEIAGLDSQISALKSTEGWENDPTAQAAVTALEAQRTQKQEQLTARQTVQSNIQGMQTLQTQLAAADAALENAATVLAAEKAAQQEAQKLAEQINAQIASLRTQISDLNGQLGEARTLLQTLNTQRASLESALEGLVADPLDTALAETATSLLFSGTDAQLALAEFQLTSGKTQLESAKTQLDSAWDEYEAAREEALEKANLDQLLSMATLAQLIYAQNFEMPAGYIQDGEDRYMLKIGGEFESVEELGGMLLCTIDGVGDVRLRDVATIEVTDNAGESYAKMNGGEMVVLAIYKGSTASTSEVSDLCLERMDELMAEDPDLHMIAIMDQGEYIRLIVNSVVSNLLWGALLAIIVLAIFLQDVRPTLVVAISIPLSVMFAIVLMYFTGITLNMISLCGLALGVGMLVDNSIVVIENIYRLRSRGVPAARASVQGARQVSASIISSTLTTICVFLPLVFSTGMVRQLMSDMGLTIAYALIASLIVALTVVPCAGSTVLKKSVHKEHPIFDKVMDKYEASLRWCLQHKAAPLAVAIALLGFCGYQLVTSGIVVFPKMSSNELTASITMAEDTPAEEAFATADAALEAIANVDGVETVGVMTSESLGGMMGMSTATDISLTNYTGYLILTEEGAQDQQRVIDEILAGTAGLDCEVTVNSGASMDLSALSGSGAEVAIYGKDLDTMLAFSEEVMAVMDEVEGITDISNGQEAGDPVLKIIVNKDQAMRYGLTVAQVYSELAQALTTETTSTTLTIGSDTYTVEIIDTTRVPDAQSIFRHEFTTTTQNEEGKTVTETHTLGEFASRQNTEGMVSISRENQVRKLTVTSSTEDGYNTTLLARELQGKLDQMEIPDGCSIELSGESTQVNEMVGQMAGMMALALLFIYFVMVAQFQSLLSPFIVLFTIPLAFTGGMIGLLISGEPLSMLSLMGFLVLMGVVVNNGIVFVDYANQLRTGGLERREALVATGRTRMRPILMTTLTTVLSMMTMIFSKDVGSEIGKGMAIVVVGGLVYATLMTLYIVPVIYELLFKKKPMNVDVGDDGMDDLPDDAAEFMAQLAEKNAAKAAAAPQQEDAFPDFPIEPRKE